MSRTPTFDVGVDAVAKEAPPRLGGVRLPTALRYVRLPEPEEKRSSRYNTSEKNERIQKLQTCYKQREETCAKGENRTF